MVKCADCLFKMHYARETTSTPKFLAGERLWWFMLEEKWNSLPLGLLIPLSNEKCDF